ncbi:restriction endonuclease subunit S [Actinomyces bovis]|nr:restriction endonuclease subunit S [Actinomyces bovis]
MSKRRVVRLKDLADLKSGGTPPKSRRDYWNGSIPWISAKTLHSLNLTDSNLCITETGLTAGSNLAPVGASLILVRGMSLLQEIRIGFAARPVAFNQDVKAIVARSDILPRYLNLALRAARPTLLAQVHQAGHGTGVLATDRLTNLPIWLPPLEEQERIAGVLGAFDDLIETSRRLALRMEDAARTMTKRITTTVPLHVIAATPHLRQRKPEGTVDHFSIPAFDSSLLPSLESGATILSGKQILEVDSVLVSRLNPKTERTWMAYTRSSAPAVCSPEFVVLQGSEGIPSEMIWTLASTRSFWEQMRGAVSGTTNSRQRVDKAAIPNFEVPDPRELDATVRHAVASLVRGAVELRIEAAHLTRQRDELLPLLMSGKVRVRDVEAVS